ncbi:MAG: hypothetical protein COB67_06720 [SAR324 cluster bacterium]|uniref:HTH LytTR-type domain-containing protein n=1 Tax=SAR324 cluster bacterium TaxID=2024889 RepID=A0A2A4T494_9DELT|nr:MAG: hypothetical protein COB67_06720 [SAR324 cluster bacterium]
MLNVSQIVKKISEERSGVLIVIIVVIMFFIFILILSRSNNNKPMVSNGFVEFGIDELHSMTPLHGDWKFIWQGGKEEYLGVPGSWNDHYSAEGFGEYELEVKLKGITQKTMLGLYLNRVGSAYELWFNSQKIGGNGVLGDGQFTERPQRRAKAFFFLWDPKLENKIKIKVSNFNQPKGGIRQSVYIGTADAINRNVLPVLDLLAVGVMLSNAAMLFLMVSVGARNSGKTNFHHGVFFLWVAIYLLFAGENMIFTFIDLPWNWYQRILHLSAALPVWHYSMFLSKVYPEHVILKVNNIQKWAVWSYALFVAFAPPTLIISALPFLHLIMSTAICYWICILYQASKSGEKEARVTLIGIIAFGVAVVFEMVYMNEGIIELNLLPIGAVISGLSHFGLIARWNNILQQEIVKQEVEALELTLELKGKTERIIDLKNRVSKKEELLQDKYFLELQQALPKIWYIHAEGGICEAYSAGRTIIVSIYKSLKQIEEDFGESRDFIRIQRNYLVPVEKIEKTVRLDGKLFLKLKNSTIKIPVGRTYQSKVKATLECKLGSTA